MSTKVLVVGATRGLGEHLAKQYAAQDGTTAYGTARAESAPKEFPDKVKWLTGIDLTDSQVGDKIVKSLDSKDKLSVVVSYK
jgi:NAD(P)-dependent dehydrogenase (short-subunit alcohol dehydrogenase family)